MVDTRSETVTGGRRVTRELAEWVAGLRYEDLPEDVVAEAEHVLIDYLGESLFVGGTKPVGQAIAAFCATSGGGQPEATIIATGKKTLASRAALANGTMALGFEYADFNRNGRPYPFAVTGPLVLAEWRKCSGKELILAIVIGYEVMARITTATLPLDRLIPFYVPALYGTLASAAACARLLNLSVDAITQAIGLAVAFTGGTFQGHEEGAWQRCLNGGVASEHGVTAALLAEAGFEGTVMSLEGVQGFAHMFTGDKLEADALFDGIGKSFVITGRWVKNYPMNTTLHAPVDALLNILRKHDVRSTEIQQISAAWQKVEPFLAKHKVSTVVAAQASLPFALAVAAVRGKVSVDEFTDETVADPAVQALIARVCVTQDLELFQRVKNSMPGRVTVRMKDGREFVDEVLYPKGSPGNRMTEHEFKAKFMNMAVRVLGQPQSEELYQRALRLREVADVSELAPLFSPKRTR